MDIQEFGLKELYEVKLKSTQNIEVGGILIEKGEVIAYFDAIQIANFNEVKSIVMSRGGKGNEPHVVWDSTAEVRIDFAQGIFTKTQMAIINNIKYLEPVETPLELIGKREILETNDQGILELKYPPHCDIYIYNAKTGDKIPRKVDAAGGNCWLYLGGRELKVTGEENQLKEFIVDYCFNYSNETSTLQVKEGFTQGFLWLEGKTRVKDDQTGLVRTGVLRIPKLKLMSNLSIRAGIQANPLVGYFTAAAYPTKVGGNKEVMRLIFLQDDIDSDI